MNIENIRKELLSKFDKIYLLTLSNRKDKTGAAIKMLQNIGLHNDDYIIHYATLFPYNNIICNAFNQTKYGKFTKPNEYDCARNHYSIIKEAYDLGYSNILIIEDDIKLISTDNIFEECIINIPTDYDILQFGGFTTDTLIEKYLTNSNNIKWYEHNDIGIWNCTMYALSRKGMEYYLAFMNNFFWVADGPLYKAPLNNKIVKSYITNIPIAIQENKDVLKSDIRDKNNDTINYDTMNLYEKYINFFSYFLYKK